LLFSLGIAALLLLGASSRPSRHAGPGEEGFQLEIEGLRIAVN
jgi:hypothetical protein